MGPSPTCHPPEGEESETLVEHGLPLCADPLWGTARGDHALPPCGGAALWGHVQ